MDDQNSELFYYRAQCHKDLEAFPKVIDCNQAIEDSQIAIELDEKNLRAHLLLGQALGMIARNQKDLQKLDTAIKRMTKGRTISQALSLCSSQDMRKFEYDILVSIRKAKKLKWLIVSAEDNLKKEDLLRKVKVKNTKRGRVKNADRPGQGYQEL